MFIINPTAAANDDDDDDDDRMMIKIVKLYPYAIGIQVTCIKNIYSKEITEISKKDTRTANGRQSRKTKRQQSKIDIIYKWLKTSKTSALIIRLDVILCFNYITLTKRISHF